MIFTLAIEPVAEFIRNQKVIQGFTIGNKEHKVALYADDIVVYLSNFVFSLQPMLNILEESESLSGLHMNKEKSEIYLVYLRDVTWQYLRSSFKFSWTFKYWRYLGVYFPSCIEGIAKYNYGRILLQICEQLKSCQKLSLSCKCGINTE